MTLTDFKKSLFTYQRRKTHSVRIGDLWIGSEHPILSQSMTTTDTLDTDASVSQIIRMVEAGCQLVRLTAPSIREAENLNVIKKSLRSKGIHVPLVADIHFTPNAAEVAARYVEKVRINPGNFAGNKKFSGSFYTDTQFDEEVQKLHERFASLVKICKEHGTAIRIGTNHGSLSDRIMERYGDSPEGMVESAMEFLRMAQAEQFDQIVLSMKSSNPQVMVQAYRLLVKTMDEHGMTFPLHLGVTEAGDGDDGRIKSSMGIGSLLEDGLGDTIRVSLTEDPEFEIPVAEKLIQSVHTSVLEKEIPVQSLANWNPYVYNKRVTKAFRNVGGSFVPVIIADLAHENLALHTTFLKAGFRYDAGLDKWHQNDQSADFIYIGNQSLPENRPLGTAYLSDSNAFTVHTESDSMGRFPVYTSLPQQGFSAVLNVLRISIHDIEHIQPETIPPNFVLLVESDATESIRTWRQLFNQNELNCPVWFSIRHAEEELETAILNYARQFGALLLDGFGDGIWVRSEKSYSRMQSVAFGILQAARARITKTEFISCPSCGRTLFDLQETTAIIRAKTGHLKGLKIAVMGCIVNGPGEMADADYGYVGSGPGKISLYKGKSLIKRSIPSSEALQELVSLIRENGDWIESE